jgi:hypothetical protein
MIHPAYSPIKRPFGILTALSTATEEVHYITKAFELVNTAVAMKGQASFFNKMNPAYSPLARPLFLSATTGRSENSLPGRILAGPLEWHGHRAAARATSPWFALARSANRLLTCRRRNP